MTFEQWRNRPVYKAQCKTFARALKLLGIKLADGQGLATSMNHPIALFRAKREYRDDFANTLRDMVALSIRMDRMRARVLRKA